MTQHEITTAAAGKRISHHTVSEIENLITMAVTRLGIPPRHQPKGETLRYIAQQAFMRHTYTAEELLLAVDGLNAGEINCSVSDTSAFSLSSLNSLMHGYREMKSKYTERPPEEDPRDTERKNEEARKMICREIYETMKAGEEPKMTAMYVWMIAFKHLLHEGKVTMQQFDAHEKIADKMFREDTMASGEGGKLAKMFKMGDSVSNYQAMLVVKDYMRGVLRSIGNPTKSVT